MLWKLVTLVAAGLALWSVARRTLGATRPHAAARRGAEDYARCPACGAWRPAGADCACRLPPVP